MAASRTSKTDRREEARKATFAAIEAYEGTDKFLTSLKDQVSEGKSLTPKQLNAAFQQLILGHAYSSYRNYDPDGVVTITCIDYECETQITGTRRQIGGEFRNRCEKHRS